MWVASGLHITGKAKTGDDFNYDINFDFFCEDFPGESKLSQTRQLPVYSLSNARNMRKRHSSNCLRWERNGIFSFNLGQKP